MKDQQKSSISRKFILRYLIILAECGVAIQLNTPVVP